MGVDPVKKNIQNELLEISKDITEELLNTVYKHPMGDLHMRIRHQKAALIAVMRNSPLLRELIFSELFSRQFLVSGSSTEFYINSSFKPTFIYNFFLHELGGTFKFPGHLLIDLIKIVINEKLYGWRIKIPIDLVVHNRVRFAQSFDDVSEYIHTIFSKENDLARARALEMLNRMPQIVQKNEKIKKIVTKLFDKIRDSKYRSSFNEDFRCMVIRCYFQAEYDLQHIPYDKAFFLFVDETCPKFRTRHPKELIKIVAQELVNRVEIGNESDEIMKFTAWIAFLAPVVEDISISEKFFNYFISVTSDETRLFLRKNSQRHISSYLISKYGGSTEEIALKCFTDYQEVVLFCISALYDDEQIPVTVLKKIYRVDYDFKDNFNWFSGVVAKQFRMNISNDEIVKLFVPFLDFKERESKVIEVLDQIDHSGLSAPKVYKILFGLMNLFMDEVSRIDNDEIRREKYGFLFINEGIKRRRDMINIPEYFAKQTKFGRNKGLTLELLFKGFFSEKDETFAWQCIEAIDKFTTSTDISEVLKWEVRRRCLDMINQRLNMQRLTWRYALETLIKLNILTIEDIMRNVDLNLSNFYSMNFEFELDSIQDLALSTWHYSGYRFVTSNVKEGASIMSIEELSEIN